jgi:hypothetical protein
MLTGDRPLSIRVAEDVQQVTDAWKNAYQPLALTREPQGVRVYINPFQILYWQEAGSSPVTES